jgi:GNAT superfamily N-acetyltransferase
VNISFRPALPADRPFLVSTWSRSTKLMHSAGLISSESWPGVMHPELERILDRDDATALIACERDDPDYFYGWVAGDTSGRVPVLFFVYVKEPYRRTGVARRLLAAIGIDPSQYFIYVSRGSSYPQLASRFRHAKHDPNVARFPKQQRRPA